MLFRSDRKSTRLNSSHTIISYAVFCLKKKKNERSGQPARARSPRVSLITAPLRTLQPCPPCLPPPRQPIRSSLPRLSFFFLNNGAPPNFPPFPPAPLSG